MTWKSLSDGSFQSSGNCYVKINSGLKIDPKTGIKVYYARMIKIGEDMATSITQEHTMGTIIKMGTTEEVNQMEEEINRMEECGSREETTKWEEGLEEKETEEKMVLNQNMMIMIIAIRRTSMVMEWIKQMAEEFKQIKEEVKEMKKKVDQEENHPRIKDQ